jgi:hypothetical protein
MARWDGDDLPIDLHKLFGFTQPWQSGSPQPQE